MRSVEPVPEAVRGRLGAVAIDADENEEHYLGPTIVNYAHDGLDVQIVCDTENGHSLTEYRIHDQERVLSYTCKINEVEFS